MDPWIRRTSCAKEEIQLTFREESTCMWKLSKPKESIDGGNLIGGKLYTMRFARWISDGICMAENKTQILFCQDAYREISTKRETEGERGNKQAWYHVQLAAWWWIENMGASEAGVQFCWLLISYAFSPIYFFPSSEGNFSFASVFHLHGMESTSPCRLGGHGTDLSWLFFFPSVVWLLLFCFSSGQQKMFEFQSFSQGGASHLSSIVVWPELWLRGHLWLVCVSCKFGIVILICFQIARRCSWRIWRVMTYRRWNEVARLCLSICLLVGGPAWG